MTDIPLLSNSHVKIEEVIFQISWRLSHDSVQSNTTYVQSNTNSVQSNTNFVQSDTNSVQSNRNSVQCNTNSVQSNKFCSV